MDKKCTVKVKMEDMGDQGNRRKKIKVEEPTLASGGEQGEENDSGGSVEHPLLEKSVIIKTCDDLKDTSILKWFQDNGSSVKILHLTCPLTCYHQSRFLEKILKKWCPILESLTLRGVQCFEVLIQTSFFALPSLENQCKSLKEFIFWFDGLKCGLQSDQCQWSELCGDKIKELESSGAKPKVKDVNTRKKIYQARSAFVEDLVDYVDLAVEPTYGMSLADRLKELVRRPIGLTTKQGAPTFGSQTADYFQQKFCCGRGYEIDGGIIGQLMKISKIEKLVIHKASENKFWNELFALYFYRENLWRSSVQEFVLEGPSPPETAHKMFSRVGFPLRKLKLDVENLQLSMDRILKNCAGTLEEFELTASGGRHLILPGLPKLKTLVLKNRGTRVVKVTGINILNKFPSLERYDVRTVGRRGSVTNFFGGADGLWKEVGGNHPLKELYVLDECMDEIYVKRMATVFPNLKIVDVTIEPDSVESFQAFWEIMGRLKRLERVKVSFDVKLKSKWDNPSDLYEKAMADNIKKFKALQRLELKHEGRHPFLLTSELSKQFAKVTNLSIFTCTNFQVDGSEAEEIKKILANVEFQLPFVRIRSSEARRAKRKL